MDVYPRAFYPAPPPEGAGLNAPATVRLAAGDVLAAAAGRQPRRAAAGSVRLSLRARGRAGGDGGGAAAAAQWDEWEVPLGGGACALVRGGGALDGAQPEATAAAAAAGCGGGRGGALENAGAGGPAWALRTARAPMDDVDP